MDADLPVLFRLNVTATNYRFALGIAADGQCILTEVVEFESGGPSPISSAVVAVLIWHKGAQAGDPDDCMQHTTKGYSITSNDH